jgi:outer membrane protein OmpA-like peptidoglycan-associated protein
LGLENSFAGGVIVRLKTGLVSVATVGVLMSACAHSYPPPSELINARAAFARASAGPARELSTSRLKLAKQALDSAEMTYGGATEQEVRDRAYVAIRFAEAAEAEATAALASQRREKALRELASMGGERAAQARELLAAAEQRASQERQRADSAEQQAASESERAAQGQREATEARERLTTEQQARAEAEARTRQALADLERLGNVRREPRGLVVTLSGQVLFATNKSTLLPAAEASLDSVAAALKALPPESPPVVVEGHTDSTGPREYNIVLSERRAQAVRDYLINKAVPSQRFTVRGLGPDRPVASNASPEGRANNRRVEIVIPQGQAAAAAARETDALPPPAGAASPAATAGTSAPPASSSSASTVPGAITPPPLGQPAVPGTLPPPRPTTTTPTPTMTAPPATTPGSVTPPPSPGRTPPVSPGASPPAPGSTPPSPGNTPPPSPGTRAPGSTTPPAPDLPPTGPVSTPPRAPAPTAPPSPR